MVAADTSASAAAELRRFRLIVAALGVLSIVTLAVGGVAGAVPSCATGNIVELELARTADRATELIGACDAAGLQTLSDGLRIDSFVFVPLYVATIVGWSLLGARTLQWSSPLRRRLVVGAAGATVLAGAFDLVENHFLSQVVDAAGASDAAGPAFAASVVKWLLVIAALVVGSVSMVRCVRAAVRGTGLQG